MYIGKTYFITSRQTHIKYIIMKYVLSDELAQEAFKKPFGSDALYIGKLGAEASKTV